MSSSTRLETLRTTLRERLLPAYEPLGQLTLVYLLGSLAAGYTEDADLDLMMVWDGAEVPAASQREPLVARLDERPGVSPFVVDYRDIHLERYVIDDQEYNVTHQTLTSFESLLQSILDTRCAGTPADVSDRFEDTDGARGLVQVSLHPGGSSAHHGARAVCSA